MLKNLTIQNYALIESLNIDFESGFSVITGETGAGKSILLGALSLILGKRADTGVLKDKNIKCIVEANFDIKKYRIKDFFLKNDIDFEDITIIRREISPTGRSRAFINDSPVNLSLLKIIGSKLIDIHSQHESLNLSDFNFQLNVVDVFSKHSKIIDKYKAQLSVYKDTENKLAETIDRSETEKANFDYLQYRFDELYEANLQANEQEPLEKELKKLNHAEEIKQNLSLALNVLSENENNALESLTSSIEYIKNTTKFIDKTKDIYNRLNSIKIEAEDIIGEIENINEETEFNPERTQSINDRLNVIYNLQNKHKVNSISELVEIREQLEQKLNNISSFDKVISELKLQLESDKKELDNIASIISVNRNKVLPQIEKQITTLLKKLGMPSARFSVLCEESENYLKSGKDIIKFLFSANKNIEPQEISKTASGGEISRLMLSLKSITAKSIAMPTIIFDEIDAGISGEIADKTGLIMQEMAKNMQLISITHLPQTAAKANFHYFVYKKEQQNSIETKIKRLNQNERITEIAKMLSGKKISEAAIENAKSLIQN